MNENFWKDKYPEGIPTEINPDQYPNIQAVLKESCQRFADNAAFTNMGKILTYGDLYKMSGDFAAWLQNYTDLKPATVLRYNCLTYCSTLWWCLVLFVQV